MSNPEASCWNVYDSLPVVSSVLYPLEPLGVGTPLVESLTSFVKRLAHAHSMKVADLVAFCGAQMETALLPSTLKTLSGIDGMTAYSVSWSGVLSKLTCRPDVVFLTMTAWGSLLNPHRLLRQHHAWCPLCYDEALRTATPLYEPLVWRLRCVDICLVHQCRLVNRCPDCGRQFTSLSNRAMVGVCPKCLHGLVNPGSVGKSVSPHTDASQQAQAVGHLLSLTPRVAPRPWHQVAHVIQEVKEQQRVTFTRIEQALHVGTTALSDIKSGQRQPSLASFARLAVFSNERLWNSLSQPVDPCVPEISGRVSSLPALNQTQISLDSLLASPEDLPGLHQLAFRCGFANTAALRKAFPQQYRALWQRLHDQQRRHLEETVRQGHRVVLSKWAQQHGYRTADLYHHFYALCLQVTGAFQEEKYVRCQAYLQAVLDGQTIPTLTAIRKALDVGDYYLKQHFAAELGRIETKRAQQSQQTEAAVHEALNRVVVSNGDCMSLHQLAAGLNKSASSLKKAFPNETRLLLNRRRVSQAEQFEVTCQQIRQTVFDLHRQGIYPSVDRIHAVIRTWMVHGKGYRRAYVEAMRLCGYQEVSSSL